MVLIGFSVGEALISSLASLAPYKWLFFSATAGLLGYGFYDMNWKPNRHCAARASIAAYCLVAATILALAGVAFERRENRG